MTTTIKSATLIEAIDSHTGLGVNAYGCVCGWSNPDGSDAAQLEHAAEAIRKAIHTPEVTEAARREVRALLPDLPAGKDVTVAIAVIDGALRACLPSASTSEGE